jgi:hypothetical protein
MKVLMISPGYPAEMPRFTVGLAEVGAEVYGLGDTPAAMLPTKVKSVLKGYLHVRGLFDEDGVVEQVKQWRLGVRFDRIECLWEPGMVLAAKLREALGVPGLSVAKTLPFRDKEIMKATLDQSGIRTPRHYRCTSVAACWDAAQQIGFPIILKPIAGAGSADTYRVNDADELRAVLPKLRHVPEVSVEEFVEGEEFTFDTITANGKILYFNVAWYRPRPLVARSNEWISPQVIALRQVDQPMLKEGVRMGYQVIEALGFESGFTHMEWYRKADGEVVFGEIGARPPGAHQVDQMNYACDIDIFREWARAVCYGTFDAKIQRKYNVATIYKRARGQGLIRRYENYRALQHRYRDEIVEDTILPIGTPRRNWRHTLVSDGFIMLRHPELHITAGMADDIAENLKIYAF